MNFFSLPQFLYKISQISGLPKTFALVKSPSHGYVMSWRNSIPLGENTIHLERNCWLCLSVGRVRPQGHGQALKIVAEVKGTRRGLSPSWEGRGGQWGKEWAWESIPAPHTLIFTQGANFRARLVQVGFQFYRVEIGEGAKPCTGWCKQNRSRTDPELEGQGGLAGVWITIIHGPYLPSH